MKPTCIIIPAIAIALTGHALASGASPTRPPRPPRNLSQAAPAETLDQSKYALGKAVFTGKADLGSNPKAAAAQREKLAVLAQSSGRDGAKLPALAGKLNASQLDALEYYVAKRYGH